MIISDYVSSLSGFQLEESDPQSSQSTKNLKTWANNLSDNCLNLTTNNTNPSTSSGHNSANSHQMVENLIFFN